MGMELVFGLGGLIIGAILAYGILANRGRSARNDRIGDAAAREQYKHPESYNPEDFRKGLRPR